MSFDPTSIVSLIQNCKSIYDYSSDVRHSTAERRRLLEEVRSLVPELEALQRLATTPGIAGDPTSIEQLGQLLDPLQPFAKVVDGTLGRIKDVLTYGTSNPNATRYKILGKRLVAALAWTADKAEVKDLLSDLERYKSSIGLALQHDVFKKQDILDDKLNVVDGKQDVMDGKLDVVDGKQDTMDGKLNSMEESLSNELRLKIAKFISKNDYTKDGKQLLEKKLSGTGTWMIHHPTFVAWRDLRESPKTLWCHGHPGTGKSVMAALIIEHLQSTPNDIVLSVFCRYSSNDFTTPFAVLGGLLRQLIEKTTKVPRTICDSYWSKTNLSPASLTGFLNEIAASHGQPIYIVVDALDECPFGSDLVCALQHLHSLFRILITSRPVFREIEDYPSIEIRASDHDILVAVNATLLKLKGAWVDDALKSTIRAKIVEKADGMFLLASLQLRELGRDVTCRRDVIAILDSLPRTLDDAYKLTFQRIRKQGERKNELVCRILALTMSCVPVRPLQYLLAEGDPTQHTNIEAILQCCHGLVRRTSNHFYFGFIHYSVHEYITTHWSELFPQHPNRSNFSLELGYSVLIRPVDEFKNTKAWRYVVFSLKEPEELKQVISLLSTPAARAALVKTHPKLAPFVHDPLLIACHEWYGILVDYMIRTAPPDVQRFNQALHVCRNVTKSLLWNKCIESINARPDMRVEDGVVVAVDPDEGEAWHWSDAEDNLKTSAGQRRSFDLFSTEDDDSVTLYDYFIVRKSDLYD